MSWQDGQRLHAELQALAVVLQHGRNWAALERTIHLARSGAASDPILALTLYRRLDQRCAWYLEQGAFDQVLQETQTLLSAPTAYIDPARVYRYRASAYLAQRQAEAALNALRLGTQHAMTQAEMVEAAYLRAAAFYQLQRRDQALSAIDQALTLAPAETRLIRLREQICTL